MKERKKFVPTQFSLGLSKELVKEMKGMKERKKEVCAHPVFIRVE
jgi:hypothetical protein